jgi:anti-sigma factor ChrR (cupin superfamily)
MVVFKQQLRHKIQEDPYFLMRTENMELYTDFSQRVILHTEQMFWLPSPAAGVERPQLERQGEEVARATSIVRYASGSYFATHTHGGGKEILVLKGVFSNEHSGYSRGSWLRSPPGSSHSPRIDPTGASLYVKSGHLVASVLPLTN